MSWLDIATAKRKTVGQPALVDTCFIGALYNVAFPMVVLRTGWEPQMLPWAWLAWFTQMIGALLVYHRFFSHRAFKTSRAFALVLALVGITSGQGGPIFWAAHHRSHHKTCESAGDVHSPLEYGGSLHPLLRFLHAQGGYLFTHRVGEPYGASVADWTRYPEIVLVDKLAPWLFLSLGPFVYVTCGPATFAYCYCGATFCSWNAVQLVNSVCHMHGDRKYATPGTPECEARNIWWLWPVMLGANWHSNHHAFPRCGREGFEWWEIDPLYYVLCVLRALGLVWEVRQPDTARLELFCARSRRLQAASNSKFAPRRSVSPSRVTESTQ